MDIGPKYVAEAKTRFPEKDWICANAVQLPLADRTFDATFLVQNTLGNMEGIEEQVFSESLRVIRPGGKLIVSAYSEDSFEIRRLWYDRLIDIGIFGRVWLDSPKIARSDTGWSSRCFDREELKTFFASKIQALEITKIDSLFYFCVGLKS
jgi:ubiquinone/menaquinone biosynthesis C-methylase UbiE